MEAKEIVQVLWVIWFGIILLVPLFRMKPEHRFYGEGRDDDEEV